MDIQPSSADKGQRCAQWWSSRWGRGRQLPVPCGRPGPDLLWHRPHQAATKRPRGVGWGDAACKNLKDFLPNLSKCYHPSTLLWCILEYYVSIYIYLYNVQYPCFSSMLRFMIDLQKKRWAILEMGLCGFISLIWEVQCQIKLSTLAIKLSEWQNILKSKLHLSG